MDKTFKMNYRENWLRTVRFEKPEYILGGIGVRTDGWYKHGIKLNDLYEKYFGHRPYPDNEIPRPDTQFIDEKGEYHRVWTDEWGCVMEERVFGIHPMIVGHPFANWKSLKDYQSPPGPDISPESIENERKRVEETKKGGGLVLQHFLRLFERLQWLRGYENLMLDLIQGSPELEKLANHKPKALVSLANIVVDYNLSWIRRSIAVGADAVGFSDDWGTQNALMINPQRWREFFKPLYKRMFEPIKEAGMIVHFHSDGYIIDIIPDLKELGVDAINPQTNCHDLEELGRLCFEKKICVNADIDRQGILSFGTVSEVKEYFHKVAYLIGSHDGGLMFSCECGSDTPLENVEAAMQVILEYRARPIGDVRKKRIPK